MSNDYEKTKFLRDKIEQVLKATDPDLKFTASTDKESVELSGANLAALASIIAWQVGGAIDEFVVLKIEYDEKVKIKEDQLRAVLKEARDKARYHSRDLGTLGYYLQTDKVHEIIEELGRNLFKQIS